MQYLFTGNSLLIFNGIAVSFILPHAALILQACLLYHNPHFHILFEACIFIAFVQIILDGCLKRRIFSGKEKGKRKKRNEYKVAFQQIQVQPCSITISQL